MLCLSAQSNPQGVPKELLEAKKLELIQEKVVVFEIIVHCTLADVAARSTPRKLRRRLSGAKSPRDRGRGMSITFAKGNEARGFGEEEEVGEAGLASVMTGASRIDTQDPLRLRLVAALLWRGTTTTPLHGETRTRMCPVAANLATGPVGRCHRCGVIPPSQARGLDRLLLAGEETHQAPRHPRGAAMNRSGNGADKTVVTIAQDP